MALKKEHNLKQTQWIEFNTAFEVVKSLLREMGIEGHNDKIVEFLNRLDNPPKEAFMLKEIRQTCKHFLGKKEIDFEEAKKHREECIQNPNKMKKGDGKNKGKGKGNSKKKGKNKGKGKGNRNKNEKKVNNGIEEKQESDKGDDSFDDGSDFDFDED